MQFVNLFLSVIDVKKLVRPPYEFEIILPFRTATPWACACHMCSCKWHALRQSVWQISSLCVDNLVLTVEPAGVLETRTISFVRQGNALFARGGTYLTSSLYNQLIYYNILFFFLIERLKISEQLQLNVGW